MDLGLNGTTVLITGANGGIGLATVKAFLQQGAFVIAHYRSSSRELEKLAKDEPTLAGRLHTIQASLIEEKDVKGLFVEAAKWKAPISVLVVNHGVEEPKDIPLADMTLDQWNWTISTNLTSYFLVIRSFLNQLPTGSRDSRDFVASSAKVAIVMVGSTAGKYGEAGHADYAASKSAAQYGLTMTLKNEIVAIAPRGRVNTVAPGWVGTSMAKATLGIPGTLEKALATTPLRKIADPVDIANQILVLSSPVLSGHVTGTTLMVEGGMEGRLLNSAESLQSVVADLTESLSG